MKVGIFSIATGKYTQFLDKLYRSIENNFLTEHSKVYVIFTDNASNVSEITSNLGLDTEIFEIQRKGFPGDTLYRYHHFVSSKERLMKRGENCPKALFYMDVDMLVADNVGDEVLPSNHKTIIATAHPGYYNRPGHNPLGTPETRSNSTAFIPNDRRRPCYWAGGFNGGEFDAFMTMSQITKDRIDIDDRNGIVAVWHDESHLNCYLSEKQNLQLIKTLTPAYCYPESWNIPFDKKIIALDKNHNEIRS
jgi:hypothetical protein